MLKTMTASQRDLAEKNYYLVTEYLRRQDLEDNIGCYDAAVSGYLHAVQAYDENAELQENYTFAMVANRRINNNVSEYLQQEQKRRVSISLDAPCRGNSNLNIYDILDMERQSPEDKVMDKLAVQAYMAGFTPRQRQLLAMRENGYSIDEIAFACGMPVHTIIKRLQRMGQMANAARITIEVGV